MWKREKVKHSIVRTNDECDYFGRRVRSICIPCQKWWHLSSAARRFSFIIFVGCIAHCFYAFVIVIFTFHSISVTGLKQSIGLLLSSHCIYCSHFTSYTTSVPLFMLNKRKKLERKNWNRLHLTPLTTRWRWSRRWKLENYYEFNLKPFSNGWIQYKLLQRKKFTHRAKEKDGKYTRNNENKITLRDDP